MLKYKSPFKVFLGAISAHAVMDGIAILLGTFFGFSLTSSLIKKVIGVLFISLGYGHSLSYTLKKPKKKF